MQRACDLLTPAGKQQSLGRNWGTAANAAISVMEENIEALRSLFFRLAEHNYFHFQSELPANHFYPVHLLAFIFQFNGEFFFFFYITSIFLNIVKK